MVYHFFTFKIEILGNLFRFQFIKNKQMFNTSVNFENTPQVDPILESSLAFQFSLFLMPFLAFIYQFLEIKEDVKVVSQLPFILGHPVLTFGLY